MPDRRGARRSASKRSLATAWQSTIASRSRYRLACARSGIAPLRFPSRPPSPRGRPRREPRDRLPDRAPLASRFSPLLLVASEAELAAALRHAKEEGVPGAVRVVAGRALDT